MNRQFTKIKEILKMNFVKKRKRLHKNSVPKWIINKHLKEYGMGQLDLLANRTTTATYSRAIIIAIHSSAISEPNCHYLTQTGLYS